ncbi:dihydroorotase [Yinghuangia seranimata]|uniref:dihydroorotase n=1 Tax=Yinghuangia seranimata TaxID=408067 RepID=UPI00248D1590|nr:dihydroorotase family protein [Yinghuangia seranimata]MDI2132433.1 dihydroorotase family protein [Yinghuangia seranimata]
MANYELVVKDGTIVMPGGAQLRADLAVRDGKVAVIAEDIATAEADDVLDAAGKVVLPGAVDAHFHIGIYRDLGLDAFEETRSSLVGGATTVISYFRTGAHYLNRTGPYREVFPEVLAAVEGKAWTDYGFHLAPMTVKQIEEIPELVREHGVTSFKYYMFYKGFDLASNSRDARAFTMGDEYDLGHLFLLMEKISEAQAEHPHLRLSLSLHCEQSELMRVFIDRVKAAGDPQTLKAYHEGRPPLTERVAIGEATTIASHTGTNVNLLHLSSADAAAAARQARDAYPHIDMRFETTLHHLCLDHDTLDARGGLGGKVNPPIRTTADNEALWARFAAGDIDWVASDHACCMEELKGDQIWPATPGFGGTALLYPVMLSEGHLKRGIPLSRIVEAVSTNPARAYNLPGKGNLLPGCDADLTVVDLGKTQTVTTELCRSGQDHCPFEGVDLTGWPVHTVVGGKVRYRDGAVVGEPSGAYLRRG